MKAVIYARYSSDNQTEASIEGQLRECMEFAEYNNIEIVEHYIDRALSAKTDNRPSFQKMIKDSYKHAFDTIIVWKLDRFARNRYDSAHYKTLLKKNGVKVISAKENIGEGSEGILLESVLEGMAEYYSAELSEKVSRGLKENALKCKNNGGGIPIGYVVGEDQRLEIDNTTAPLVVEAYKMYADGKLIKDIVKHFEDKGMKTKYGNKITYNIVQHMLNNRKYIGEYKFKDVIVPNGVPRIVSDELFEKVQSVMDKNRHAPARHKAEDDYILTTKLRCGKCGAYMVGESGTGRSGIVHRYYKCVGAKKHTCDKKTVRKDWIEDLVIKQIFDILVNDELIALLTDRIYLLQKEENPRLPILRNQKDELDKRIGNMLNAIEQGVLFDSTKERLASLEKEKKELEIVIAQEQIKQPFLTKEQIKWGIEKFKKLDISSKEGKQKLVDSFVNTIYLFDDKIIYTFNYKDSSKTVYLSEIESANRSGLECATAPT